MSQMSANTTIHNFYGFVQQDGKIFAQEYQGPQQIGVTNQVYADLQNHLDEVTSITEQYKARLIELGEIEVPMTQDDIIREQQKQLQENQRMMKDLLEQVKSLTTAKEVANAEHSIPDRQDTDEPQNEEASRASSGSSKRVSSRSKR